MSLILTMWRHMQTKYKYMTKGNEIKESHKFLLLEKWMGQNVSKNELQ